MLLQLLDLPLHLLPQLNVIKLVHNVTTPKMSYCFF
jgi:hypothetical protein